MLNMGWKCIEPLEILGFSRVLAMFGFMEKYRNVVLIDAI